MEYHEVDAGREPAVGASRCRSVPTRTTRSRRASSPSRSAWSPPTRSRDFRVVSRAYPLQIREQTPHGVAGSFTGRNVTFSEDFSVEYSLDPRRTDTLEVVTYRNPEPGAPNPTETAPRPRGVEPGFFQASALIAPVAQADRPKGAAAPRTVIALFDTSLSMQWEKLERSFQALEAVLRSLRPADRFNLLLFNTETTLFAPAPVAADTAAVEKALDFVRAGRLRGDTDLQRALGVALDQSQLGDRRSLHRPARRRERHARDDRERAARRLVCEAARRGAAGRAAPHLSLRHRRRRQRAAAQDAEP